LTLSPTQSPVPPQLEIDVQYVYQFRFRCSTYAWKEDEIKFRMAHVPGPTKIRLDKNCRNNFNIQSLTCPRAVHIKTDAQVTYNIQLGLSWTPWKDKEITFPMELVPCTNSSGIDDNHQNNWTPRIYFCVARCFWPLGRVSCLAHYGCVQGLLAHP
jgi:hypothetical protein